MGKVKWSRYRRNVDLSSRGFGGGRASHGGWLGGGRHDDIDVERGGIDNITRRALHRVRHTSVMVSIAAVSSHVAGAHTH
jgi:hypothetical protein